jgi:transposase
LFLKKIRVPKKGRRHTYWALVKSVRTDRGPRHEVVSYLGELRPSERKGWAKVGRFLDGRPEPALPLFDRPRDEDPVPETIEVRLRKVRVERTRDFGEVWLGLALWRALELDHLLKKRMPPSREAIPWSIVAAIVTLARFCEPSSELHIAERWYGRTGLEDLLGVPEAAVYPDRLYRVHDRLLPHKTAIERHLKKRFETLFDSGFDLLFYDVTSTYFEGEAASNPQAQRGYSRDKRSDCKQVCIGLVVNIQGLPVGYEVFDGNRTDVTTLEEMVETLEEKHGRARRIWVLDRGLVSPENLEFLRERDGRYIVGTPKGMLKQFERALLEKGWTEVQAGVEVKRCPGPDGEEVFVLCRSGDRGEKEQGMHQRFERRIEEALQRLARRLGKAKKLPDRVQVERQIGRILERNSRSAGLFDIRVTQVTRGERKGHLKLHWRKRRKWQQWAQLTEGCYLLRTNLVDWKAEDLWRTYIQLTQAEAAFRTTKTDLNLRPIWHHLEDRVQAHILFSFLAYAMWKTLELWMEKAGLGNSPRPLIEELRRIKTNDVILGTPTGREVRIRCVTRPDRAQMALLNRMGLRIPDRLGEPRWEDPKRKM